MTPRSTDRVARGLYRPLIDAQLYWVCLDRLLAESQLLEQDSGHQTLYVSVHFFESTGMQNLSFLKPYKSLYLPLHASRDIQIPVISKLSTNLDSHKPFQRKVIPNMPMYYVKIQCIKLQSVDLYSFSTSFVCYASCTKHVGQICFFSSLHETCRVDLFFLHVSPDKQVVTSQMSVRKHPKPT